MFNVHAIIVILKKRTQLCYKIIRLAHLAELEMLGLEGLVDQMVLLWPHLDGRGGGGGHLFQAVQHLPDVELLHLRNRRAQNGDRPQKDRRGTATFSRTRTHAHAHTRTHTRTQAPISGADLTLK